jgi:transposase
MAGKRSTPEQVVAKLRQVEVLTAQGKPVAEAVRAIGISEPSYYRWRAEYGGLKLDQVKRLKQLEAENARLKKLVAERDLEIEVMKEVAAKNW